MDLSENYSYYGVGTDLTVGIWAMVSGYPGTATSVTEEFTVTTTHAC